MKIKETFPRGGSSEARGGCGLDFQTRHHRRHRQAPSLPAFGNPPRGRVSWMEEFITEWKHPRTQQTMNFLLHRG